MNLSPLLSYSLQLAGQTKYLLVFVVTIIEGPILMMTAGFLLHEGYFSVVPLFLTLIAGDLAGDIAWYYIGYHFAEPLLRKHGHIMSVTPELLEKAKRVFKKYHAKILFISKITIGFGMALATLMTAGATRIPLRKYLLLNALAEVVLVAALLAIGYSFGTAVESVIGNLKLAFAAGLLIIGAAAIFGFSKYMKNKITAAL